MGEENVLLRKNGIMIYEDTYGKVYFSKDHPESVVVLARKDNEFILIR